MPTRISISTKINVFMLFLVFIPLCTVLALIYHQVQQKSKAMSGRHLASVATLIAEQVGTLVAEFDVQIEGIAENPVIRSETATLGEKLVELRRLVKTYGFFDDVVLLDLEGRILASALYDFRGNTWTETWFAWHDKSCFLKARDEGASTLEQIRTIHSTFWFTVAAAAPVIGGDGKPIHVVGGKLSMQRIWEITDRADVGKSAIVFIADRAGKLIAHPEVEKRQQALEPKALMDAILAADTGTIIYDVVGEFLQGVCGFRRMPALPDGTELGWVVGIADEVTANYSAVDKLKEQVLAFSVGSLLFLFAFGWLLSRQITGPITELVKTSERIAAGKMNSRAEVKNRDEIGDLANSFNKMTEDLQQTIISLDLEINARKEAQELLRTARFQQDFSGLLNIISIVDVIQLINAAQKSGVLEIRKFPATVIATLSFLDGEIIAGSCDGSTAEEAVYKTLRSKGEEFHFTESTPEQPAQPMSQRTMGLLMEGLRLMDEGLPPEEKG